MNSFAVELEELINKWGTRMTDNECIRALCRALIDACETSGDPLSETEIKMLENIYGA